MQREIDELRQANIDVLKNQANLFDTMLQMERTIANFQKDL